MNVRKKDVKTVLAWAYRMERQLEAEGYNIGGIGSRFYTRATQEAHSRILDALAKGN